MNKHILSIWLVDPVGGEYYDWPGPDEEILLDSPDFNELLSYPEVKDLSIGLLAEKLQEIPMAQFKPHEAKQCIKQCDAVISLFEEISFQYLDQHRVFYSDINKIRNVLKFAQQLEHAHVCIT